MPSKSKSREEALAWLEARTVADMPTVLAGVAVEPKRSLRTALVAAEVVVRAVETASAMSRAVDGLCRVLAKPSAELSHGDGEAVPRTARERG
jgi:hypothetical protein